MRAKEGNRMTFLGRIRRIRRSGVWILAWLLGASVATQAGTLAQFRTVFGDIEVELFDQDKPITVQNFVRYVQSGRYRNLILHRCDPAFVVQGGGFIVTNRGTTNWRVAYLPTFGAISNEFSAGTIHSNTYGTIAMARVGGQTNSATSQWFFNLTNSPFLDTVDGGFTVFGRMVRGTNVLDRFRMFRRYSGTETSNVIANLGSPLNELPLLSPFLSESNLLFVDVSLLNVQIRSVGAAREISWNSARELTNRVEFTTNLPPVWHVLTLTNGSGETMTVLDGTAGAPSRFYRVLVNY